MLGLTKAPFPSEERGACLLKKFEINHTHSFPLECYPTDGTKVDHQEFLPYFTFIFPILFWLWLGEVLDCAREVFWGKQACIYRLSARAENPGGQNKTKLPS